MRIEALRTLNDLSYFRKEWKRLWLDQAESCPYKSFDWNIAWIKTNSLEKRMNILIAWEDDGTLVGVAPLQRIPLVVPGWCALTFIGQETSISPDFLVTVGREREFCEDILQYIFSGGDIKAIVLKMAYPLRGAAPLLESSFAEKVADTNIDQYSQRPIVELPESYEEFLQGLNSKMRQEMRAARKKLAAGRNLELRHDGVGENFATLLADLFDLNDLRWGRSGGRRVYESLYPQLHEAGMLKIFILYADGRPASGLSALLAGDAVYAELAGFDYNIESRHLGKGFYGLIIEWAIQNGYRIFDFSSGSEEYKLRFKPEIYPKYRLVITETFFGRFSLAASRAMGKRFRWFREAAIA